MGIENELGFSVTDSVDHTEIFNLDNVDHEIVETYRPKFLAKGGQQIVYEIPEHPNVVAKVAVGPLKEIINWNIAHDKPADSLSEEVVGRSQELLKRETDKYWQLKKYFGGEHVPNQRQYLIEVPVSPLILNQIYANNPPVSVDKAWSVMTVQERVAELGEPSKVALVGGYAEDTELPIEANVYRRVTEHLVFNKNPEEVLSREDFVSLQWGSDIKKLLEKADEDEHFKAVLQELIEKAISYTNDTGEILDLAGDDNVILFQKDDVWSYTLVDAQYQGPLKMLSSLKINLEKMANGMDIDEEGVNIVLNAFNYLRTVNGLAEQLGSRKRIYVPPDVTNLEIDFQSLLRRNFERAGGEV